MSRRQHVVRTDDQGGIGLSRSLGGCEILCAREDCGEVGTSTLIAPIAIASTRNYLRCFVSATVGQIHTDSYLVVELYHEEADYVIASVQVPTDKPTRLSGIIDLPEGESTLCIRMYAANWNGWGDYDGAGLQVVIAQPVDERGCIVPSGGCG